MKLVIQTDIIKHKLMNMIDKWYENRILFNTWNKIYDLMNWSNLNNIQNCCYTRIYPLYHGVEIFRDHIYALVYH
jgi:hypothetical protein